MTETDLIIQELRRKNEYQAYVIRRLALDANPCRFCKKDCDSGRGCEKFELKEGRLCFQIF